MVRSQWSRPKVGECFHWMEAEGIFADSWQSDVEFMVASLSPCLAPLDTDPNPNPNRLTLPLALTLTLGDLVRHATAGRTRGTRRPQPSLPFHRRTQAAYLADSRVGEM